MRRFATRKGPFSPEDFSATKFSSSADKAEFGNTLLHFVEAGCKRELFTNALYQRLSNCFAHIAHSDHETFYETWFADEAKRLRFIVHTLCGRCWPDPAYTFSDVERAVQREIESGGYLARYELQAAVAVHPQDMEMLKRLETKYRSSMRNDPAHKEQSMAAASETGNTNMSVVAPVQANLFERV